MAAQSASLIIQLLLLAKEKEEKPNFKLTQSLVKIYKINKYSNQQFFHFVITFSAESIQQYLLMELQELVNHLLCLAVELKTTVKQD